MKLAVCCKCGKSDGNLIPADAEEVTCFKCATSASRRPKGIAKMTEGYNRLRDALIWFDSHEVEKKLGHLPQWVVMGRELTGEK